MLFVKQEYRNVKFEHTNILLKYKLVHYLLLSHTNDTILEKV